MGGAANGARGSRWAGMERARGGAGEPGAWCGRSVASARGGVYGAQSDARQQIRYASQKVDPQKRGLAMLDTPSEQPHYLWARSNRSFQIRKTMMFHMSWVPDNLHIILSQIKRHIIC